jgi:hypothetical protein
MLTSGDCSSLVVDFLLKRREETTSAGVTWIYCSYDDQQSQTAINLLSSLLRQLLQQVTTLPGEIRTTYAKCKEKGVRMSLDECVDFLNSAMQPLPETFIVIDALDECTQDYARQLMKSIFLLTRARIMVASRPTSPNLGRYFDSCPSLEIYARADDVESYVKARIEEDYQLSELVNEHPELRRKIVTTIAQKSHGM